MTSFDVDDAPAAPGFSGARRRGSALLGARWALGFALALAAAFVFVLAVHGWRDHAATPQEMIVQLPVPADNAATDNRPDLTAPDPGDNP